MKRQEQLSQAQGLSDHARIVLQTFHELLKVQGLSQVNSVVLSRDPAGMLMLGSGRRWSSTSSPLGVAGWPLHIRRHGYWRPVAELWMEKPVSCGRGAQESGAHLQFCLEPNALLVSCLYNRRLGRNDLYVQFDPVIL